MKFSRVLPMVIAVLFSSWAGFVFAVPSAMSHEMSGMVKARDDKTITIPPDGESKVTVFRWNSKDTQFIRNGKAQTISSLEIGTKVQIRCSHPIIGSAPLLYRVSWQTVPGTKHKSH